MSSRISSQPLNKCLCAFVEGHNVDGEDEDDEDERYTLKCPACVHRSLKPLWDRHAEAVRERDRVKAECTRHVDALPNPHRLGELQAESQLLRERLTVLRKKCGDMAVRVASQAVENDLHREAAQRALSTGGGTEDAQYRLEQLEQSLIQGSLHHALDVASKQVRVLRFQWARKALAMHRLDIDPNDAVKANHTQQRQSKIGKTPMQHRARGIGKIGGLPLPHAGPELYGVLPPKELQSALRLVASVTCTLARCLGIVLPHPILLTSSSVSMRGDITDTVSDHELQRRLRENHHTDALVHDRADSTTATTTSRITSLSNPSSSSGSIMSLMDTSYWKKSARKALALATGQSTTSSSTASSFPSSSSTSKDASEATPSMDSRQLSLRIHHATAAVLAEDSSPSSSKFALSAEVMHQQDFAIALQLLQNNIVVLCIRAGVPVGHLWPGEAILLNLYQLDQYCQEQTGVTY